jgi:hypothetical protein
MTQCSLPNEYWRFGETLFIHLRAEYDGNMYHWITDVLLERLIRNSVVWARERTIPTERPPLVGEVLRIEGATWSAWRSYSRLSRLEPLLFLSSSSAVVLTTLSGPRSRPTTSQKIWQRRESNPDLWICSQELWSIDHRGGLLSST